MKLLVVAILAAAAFFLGFVFHRASICNAAADSGSRTISATEFNRHLSVCHPTLIDVRTGDEFASGHITGAINADVSQTEAFNQYLNTLDKNRSYFIYCRTGKRSAQALELMTQQGFTQVTNLDGGITTWQSANFPVVKE